ncbi:hypothetical protein [Peribacillus deserti]|nr:hypothetical protein [Peribacillus deserti]
MVIHFNPIDQTFHLKAMNSSYVMGIMKDGYLVHLGARSWHLPV